MKKKKTYLLLAIVVFVWGYLGYKVYSSFYGDEEDLITNKIIDNKQAEKKVQKEKLKIKYPDKDPFLGKMYSPKIQKKVSKEAIKITYTYDSIFDKIRYKGFINNKTDTSPLYLLSYKQKSYVIKPNHKFDGILLLGGTPDEIKVNYKTVTKTIKLEN